VDRRVGGDSFAIELRVLFEGGSTKEPPSCFPEHIGWLEFVVVVGDRFVSLLIVKAWLMVGGTGETGSDTGRGGGSEMGGEEDGDTGREGGSEIGGEGGGDTGREGGSEKEGEGGSDTGREGGSEMGGEGGGDTGREGGSELGREAGTGTSSVRFISVFGLGETLVEDVIGSSLVEVFDMSYKSKLAPLASKSVVSNLSKPFSGAKARARHSSGATVTESTWAS
jgi:hypothetical protein